MNKKKLPRAVTQTADDMRKTGAIAKMASAAETDSNAQAEGRASTPNSAPLVQRAKRRESVDADAARALSPKSTEIDATRRRSRAEAIVERYANFSALGGIIPLPLVNVASITVIILRMVKLLSEVYGVPYEHGRARAVVVGLAAGAVPTTASAVTTSTLIYFVPGVNLLGLAVSSVTASVCTRAIGRRFVEHFETGATLMNFPVIDRR